MSWSNAVVAVTALVAIGCAQSTAAPAPAASDRGSAATADPPTSQEPAGVVAEPATTSETPGVTATEIRIGQTAPYSGPAAAYGVIGKVEAAYFQMINDAGGVGGRKIRLISLDDGYVPARSVMQVRTLIENEDVALMFSSVGTQSNVALRHYLNGRHVPQLFAASGADRWADPVHFPWTIGWQPSYRIEARVWAKYLLAQKPSAKICVMFQNDDFGKDYLEGLREVFAERYDQIVVKQAAYEASAPVIDPAIDQLWISGCDTLLAAATPRFAVQAIRKMFELGWRPTLLLANISASRSAVLQPVGLDKAAGLITGAYFKDPGDPANARDRGLAAWRTFMTRYVPGGDQTDLNAVFGYAAAQTLVQVLKQCGNDLSRQNIMKQAVNLRHIKSAVLLDGIEINTSATDFRPISQLQLMRFNGTQFERLGGIIDGD